MGKAPQFSASDAVVATGMEIRSQLRRNEGLSLISTFTRTSLPFFSGFNPSLAL